MADVSTASVVVANAFSSMLSSVGESSLSRLVSGADATVHNLIEGVVSPTTRRNVEFRGYKYRNNGAPGAEPVLTPQQLQVAKTSLDPRIVKIQRDAVNLLTRACQTSDAIGRQHPNFEDVGAVNLRLTIPVPTGASIEGFQHHDIGVFGLPKPSGGDADSQGNSATCENEDGAAPCELVRTDSDFVPGWNEGVDVFLLGSEHRDESHFDSYGGCPPESSKDSSSDGDSEADTPSEDGVPLGLLGNALRARAEIQRAMGQVPSPTVTMECSFCSWLNAGRAKGFITKVIDVANPCGVRDLYVLDVILPTGVLTTCMDVCDSLAGEDKPAKNLHLQKVVRKLRRTVSGSVNQAEFSYLQTVANLVVMAMLLDTGDSGKNHCDIMGYSSVQPDFKDFFADKNLEEAVDDLAAAKADAGHDDDVMVYAVPAPEIQGSLNETLVLYETNELGDYELKEKKRVVGAVHTGVDLLGKPSPNDHTNPLNFIGAVYRHFGDSETAVAAGTPDEYVVHLDRSEKSELTANQKRVWEDLIDKHAEDFKYLLTSDEQRFDYDFWSDGKPNSYATEDYEKWLGEQMQDERFFAADNALNELLANTKATARHIQELRASAACKKGEDSSRARAVITPGVAGSEGLHQCRNAPNVKALEALHAILYNHTNLKGLTEDTKRIRFAEFLRAIAKGAVGFGTDKRSNDSCFRNAVWKMCCRYLAVMNDIFEEYQMVRGHVYTPDEHLREDAFPHGSLDLKYWILKLTPLLAILLSGIGPTSFLNRLESTVDQGVAVLEIHGEEAYQKWWKAQRQAVRSDHPEWSKHSLPHVAEHVEWAPLAPRMVRDTNVKSDQLKEEDIITPHMGISEGDDQMHAFLLPQTPEWTKLSTRESVVKFTAIMSAQTKFIFEPALTADEFDMVGRNAIIEMLSAWIGLPSGKSDNYEVAVIVPKVLKAIRKLPHSTLSSQHTVVRDLDGSPLEVVRDGNYWALALTKYYALAIINKESLGNRGLFLSHGDYCYAKLESLVGCSAARSHPTLYGDRDPEKRGLEEAARTTFEVCGELRDNAHETVCAVHRDRVTRVCCTAWRSELPELAALPKEDVVASLLAFDSVTMTTEITDEHVKDPMLLWTELEDIGCLLEPLVRHATAQHKKVSAMFRNKMLLADAEQTVQLARSYASVKPRESATKEGGSDDAAKPPGGGKGKGGAKSKAGGKGGKAWSQSQDAKGKASSKSKGKGRGSGGGKGTYPLPSWRRGSTGDSWWRSSGGPQ